AEPRPQETEIGEVPPRSADNRHSHTTSNLRTSSAHSELLHSRNLSFASDLETLESTGMDNVRPPPHPIIASTRQTTGSDDSRTPMCDPPEWPSASDRPDTCIAFRVPIRVESSR